MREKFFTVKELNSLLPVETSEVFEIISLKRKSAKFISNYGIVNLERLTINEAQRLLDAGAPFIKLRPIKAKTKKTDTNESTTD